MIYLLTYLIVGLPVSIVTMLATNVRKDPIWKRILGGFLYWSVWPLLMAALALDLLMIRRIQITCAWCGELVGTGEPNDWKDRKLWGEHAHKCPKHPLREELDDLRGALGTIDQAACYPADVFPETRGNYPALLEKIHEVAFTTLEGKP